MKRFKRILKNDSKSNEKKTLEHFNVSLNTIIKEKIELEDLAKKESTISSFMKDLEKLDKYNVKERNDGIQNYIKLIDKLRKVDVKEHMAEIKGIYEVLLEKEVSEDISLEELTEEYTGLLNNIEKNITDLYRMLINNEARTAAPRSEGERRVHYNTLLKGYKLIGDILVKKEFNFTQVVSNLVLVSDLNNYCAQAWKDTLEQLLVTYREDVYKEVGDKLNISEENDKIKRRVDEMFFIAREKVLKNIAYGIIDKHHIDESYRPHVLDVCTKYINKYYGFNISETELKDSYMYPGLKVKYTQMLQEYIKDKNLDELVFNDVIKQYSEAVDGENAQKVQNEIVDWTYSYLDRKNLDKSIERNDFLSEYIYNDILTSVRKIALEEILVDKGYIKKKTTNKITNEQLEQKIIKAIEYEEREEDEKRVKNELENYIKKEGDESKQAVIATGIIKSSKADEHKDLVEKVLKRLRTRGGQIALWINVLKINDVNWVKRLVEMGVSLKVRDDVGTTYLHYACSQSGKNIVEYLIDKGLDVNTANYNGLTPLMIAVALGKKDVIRTLVERGADVNREKEDDRYTALKYACINRDLETMKYLVENKANVKIADIRGNTLLHEAVRVSSINIVEYLIEQGLDINDQNYNGDTPLIIACARGDSNMAEYLATHGANFEIENKNGDKAITVACERADLYLVKTLVEKGANINTENRFGETLLGLAIKNRGGKKVVEYLIEQGVDVNKKIGDVTPLEFAINKNRVDIANMLLLNGANIDISSKAGFWEYGKILLGFGVGNDNINYLIDKDLGFSLMISAVANNNKEVQSYLIEHDVDISANSEDIKQALIYASRSGNIDVAMYVIDNVSRYALSDIEWEEIILEAGMNKHTEIAEYILKKKYNANEKDKEVGNNLLIKFCSLDMDVPVELIKTVLKYTKNIDEKNNAGDTALRYAVYGNNPNILKTLVENGADINIQNDNGDTALMHACFVGKAELAKYLVEKGANVNIENQNNDVALGFACANKDIELVKYLLKHGANPNIKDVEGSSILTDATDEGDLELVKCLIEGGADPNIKTNNNRTPLMIACEYGYLDIAKYLLEHSANIEEATIKEKDKVNITPLMAACSEGYPDIAKELLEKGADVNEKDKKEESALFFACRNGDKEVVKTLIEHGADINAENVNGITALKIACAKGNVEIAQMLVDMGVDVNKADNAGGFALATACYNGKKDIVEVLIKNKADVNQTTTDKFTSLMLASIEGYKDIVDCLLEKKANINAQTADGRTALMFAAKENKKEMVKYLVDKGADVNLMSQKGETALIFAVASKEIDMVEYLVNKGADVNLEMPEGNTALSIAANTGNIEIIDYLVKNKANINKQNHSGYTALIIGVLNKDEKVVKKLIEYGVDLDKQTDRGSTALMLAVKTGSTNVVKMLLENNAKVDLKDKEGKTALEMAKERGNAFIIALLNKSILIERYKKEVIDGGNYKLADALKDKGLKFEDIEKIYQRHGMTLYSNCVNCLYKENGKLSKSIEDFEKILELIENVNTKGTKKYDNIEKLLEQHKDSLAYNKVVLIALSTLDTGKTNVEDERLERKIMRVSIEKIKNQDLKWLKETSLKLESKKLLREVIRKDIITKKDLQDKNIDAIVKGIKNEEIVKMLEDMKNTITVDRTNKTVDGMKLEK